MLTCLFRKRRVRRNSSLDIHTMKAFDRIAFSRLLAALEHVSPIHTHTHKQTHTHTLAFVASGRFCDTIHGALELRALPYREVACIFFWPWYLPAFKPAPSHNKLGIRIETRSQHRKVEISIADGVP